MSRLHHFAALAVTLPLSALLFVPGAAIRSADEPRAAERLQIKPGDHLCIIGNTLADRMQHHGWLETLIQARFPDKQLVFRNLGFSGDEVFLKLRIRSASFGSPDTWLTRTKADVIFAFFGYGESFAGKEGMEKFKTELDGFIKDSLARKYNGTSAQRLQEPPPAAVLDQLRAGLTATTGAASFSVHSLSLASAILRVVRPMITTMTATAAARAAAATSPRREMAG